MDFLLGIDIGTSNIKTSLFNTQGKELYSSTKEYPFYNPRPGWVEQNPLDWWEGVKETIKNIIFQSRINSIHIKGIGISSQSWGVISVDKNGNILRPAILWMDRRSTEQSKKIEQHMLRNGWDVSVDSSYIVPKILWIRENECEVYKKTYKFLQVNTYINYKLSKEIFIDISQEDPLQIYIRNQKCYKSLNEFYESLGIEPEKVPDVKNSFDIIGPVSSDAAKETGLAPGTPIVAGAMDTSASALGMQVVNHGQSLHVAGQAGAIGVCQKTPVFDRRICIHNHVIPNRWLIMGVMVATGASMRWFRDELGKQELLIANQIGLDPFMVLSIEAEKSAPGAGGVIFLPYMMGERTPMWDYNARGTFFGLSLHTTKSDLIRAIMEGCSYALRHNIETLNSMGLKIEEIVSAGGAIKSDIWNQIKSDVTKKNLISIRNITTATLGAAILAGLGIGIYKEPLKFEKFILDKKTFTPRIETDKKYDCLYEIYKRLYIDLKADFNSLAEFQTLED